MTCPITFSGGVIQEIFGREFASELNSRQEDIARAAPSNESGQTDGILIDGTGRAQSGKSALDKKNLESFFKEQQHVEGNRDGVKPTKSPRQQPVPPSQHLTVDVDPLLPIRNYIRKTTGPPTRHYAPEPLPKDLLGEIMNEKLQASAGTTTASHNQEGRLGPKVAKFDIAAHFGSFVMSSDRLGLTSQCNFGSVRANVCLFKGKWQYEVQLGSKGVMQVGWSTLATKFSQEKGVGDSADSFGFDGNRNRKWNGTTAPYGEQHWMTGDIIGCLIDFDGGNIEYQRNGKSLGIAFSDIPKRKGIAYYPTVSLAWGESLVANFGASPLQFPAAGYVPIQAEIPVEDTKVPLLLTWLENTLRIYPTPEDPTTGLHRLDYETLLVVANRIFQFLAPSMNSAFLVEQSFLPFYARTIGLSDKVAIHGGGTLLPPPGNHAKVHLLLDLMWTFLEEAEMKKAIERICVVLMNWFRSNSLSLSYPLQVYSLRCLIALSTHRKTRRFLLHHILFDQIKLMHFLHIRPVDDEVLKIIMPNGWWAGKSGPEDPEAIAYKATCDSLKHHIQAVEDVQMEFLRTLLVNSDGSEKRPSSRSVFLRKFRAYIRDSLRPGSLLQHPMNRALCAFFRVLKITMLLWKEEVQANDDFALPDLPSSMFFDLTLDYQDADRLGGVANYLYKTYHEQVSAAISVPDYFPGSTSANAAQAQLTPMTSFFGFQAGLAALAAGSASASSPSMAEDDIIPGPSDTSTTISASAPNVPNAGGVATATSTVRNTLSIGVSTDSESQPMAPIGFGVPDAMTGMQTPTLGVIHPPAPHFTTVSHTENVPPNIRPVSATSSAEEVVVPRMTALIAGTSSGTNLMIPVYDFPRQTTVRVLPGGVLGFSFFDRVGIRPNNPALANVSRDSGVMDSRTSLVELLDDSIMIFSCGVKRHLEKIVTLRRNTEDFVKAMEDAQEELSRPGLLEEARVELTKSVEIFSQKLQEQSRHMAWVQSGVFTPERQRLAFQLLKVVVKTLKSASAQGILFVFVPEFYITTLIHLTWLLLGQFHPTVPYTDLPGIDEVLREVGEFVATHFIDSRIANGDTKDILTHALGAFISDKKMLSSLEQMPTASMKRMVKYLLRPYENRAWAQSNYMLLRFWQGSGFAFRYSSTAQARKAFRSGPGPQQDEFLVSSNLPPNPSPVFQRLIATVLSENPKLASNFIHSVLNQLNWAFSEFVGLLQEIHSAATRNERALMESRQLKIASTTHELTQSLLRVLEMVISQCPQVLTDVKRESSEVLLDRLSVLLSQVLNRIGAASGIFAQVIELGISGIENISYFPILTSIAGIILALAEPELEETDPSRLVGTRAILHEPSFQVSSLDFFLGRNIPESTPPVLQFSLRHYIPEDIDEEEVRRLENVVKHITDWAPRLETSQDEISDDDICTICYAYAKSHSFLPCKHRSCRSCILHHLMNHTECFFCKRIIEQVVDDDSGVTIHDIHKVVADSDSETTIASLD